MSLVPMLTRKICYLLMSITILAGCTLQLVASYDAVTDKNVTQLQKDVDGMLYDISNNIGKPAAEYAKFKDTYKTIYVNLETLQTRAEAIPNNTQTIQQLKLCRDAVEKFEQLHKLNFKSPQELVVSQNAFDAIFRALLTLELAKKKQGEL